MSMKWAKIQTAPSVAGIVIRAKTSGTAIAASVPNMNAITRTAIGTAIVSPRRMSSL